MHDIMNASQNHRVLTWLRGADGDPEILLCASASSARDLAVEFLLDTVFVPMPSPQRKAPQP